MVWNKEGCGNIECLGTIADGVIPWGGPLCTDCKRSEGSCFHSGKFDEDTCRCKECDAPWKGAICGECGITTEHCKNGGTPCTKSCRCVNCNRPWRGQFCKQCGLSNDDCENGGTVDTNTCTCTCHRVLVPHLGINTPLTW